MSATDHDWTTPEGLQAVRAALASSIEGWQAPTAYAVGLSPASSSPELDFPQINPPGTGDSLSAVVLAKVLGHAAGTATYPVTAAALESAIRTLEPAEACSTVQHSNLVGWRRMHAELEANPARTAYAVFVADLDDPVVDVVDASFRARLEGHAPQL